MAVEVKNAGKTAVVIEYALNNCAPDDYPAKTGSGLLINLEARKQRDTMSIRCNGLFEYDACDSCPLRLPEVIQVGVGVLRIIRETTVEYRGDMLGGSKN